jgi:hypothetical protein
MASLVNVKFTVYNIKTSRKLLLPLRAVHVENFLVGLSVSRNLDIRKLARQDSQISYQLGGYDVDSLCYSRKANFVVNEAFGRSLGRQALSDPSNLGMKRNGTLQ